ncbi:hypothetical protein JCM10908_000878 [Rhodotorula pacifica]|uniref:uncharacterized protein n=1 Tax=Rhodotorula pacifica TaxID=1495444 RepID=UPI0031706D9B
MPRRRKVMPLGDSSNRIRARTPDARLKPTLEPVKPALAPTSSDSGSEKAEKARKSKGTARSVARADQPELELPFDPPAIFNPPPTSSEKDRPDSLTPVGASTTAAPPPTESTTPPRPSFQPVQVVETCPTPPSAATTLSSRLRRRPLLESEEPLEAGHGCAVAVVEAGKGRSLPLGQSAGVSSTVGDGDIRATFAGAHAQQQEEEQEEAIPERVSSLDLPSSWQYDTLTRRQQPPRTSHSPVADDPAARPSFELDSTELVTALLARPPPAAASRRSSYESRRSGSTSKAQSVRLAPAHSALPEPDTAEHPPRASTKMRLSPPPPVPSRTHFRPLSPSPHPLRTQASTASLLTWDMSHLPAPHTPRESPFRVSWKSVLLPTSCLGGGKGSGMYGDQWGAVERKVKTRMPEREEEDAKAERRWSWRPSAKSFPSSGSACPPIAEQHTLTYASSSSLTSVGEEDLLDTNEPKKVAPSRKQPSSSLLRRFSRNGLHPRSATPTVMHDSENPGKVTRRRSLVASIFGGAKSTSSRRSSEDLNQWVSVVIR